MCSRCLCWKNKGSVYQDQDKTKETQKARRSTKGNKDVINHYHLGDVLGSGAFGVVRSATKKGEKFAIKLLSKARLKRSRVGLRSNALELLKTEIAVWKKLTHPNVCNLIEVINDVNHEEVYLVSEYIKGGMLLPDKRIVEPIEEEMARSFCRQILLGLEYLHAIGIAHRDIKPANVLLTERTINGTVKLCDFGVSSIWDKENGGTSDVKNTVGTMEFFAPEMCRDGGKEFEATMCDVWAVGVTLYLMLCGEMPAKGNSMDELFQSILTLEIKRSNIKQDVQDRYESGAIDLLGGLLNGDPKERWSVERALDCDWLNKRTGEQKAILRRISLKFQKVKVSKEEVENCFSPVSKETARAIARFNSFRSINQELEDDSAIANQELPV